MNKKGFTMVELLSAIFVLGIVLVVAITSTIGIYKSIKQKAFEEKIAIIEESAILFGENRKENIIKSTSVYKDVPCKSFKLRELVPKYIENDTNEECINSENGNEIGCIIDPSDKNNYLDETEVIVYYQNKRIYSVVDINDELECERTKLSPTIKEFYIEDGNTFVVNHAKVNITLTWEVDDIKYYCITDKNNAESCTWNDAANKSVTTEYTLSNGDGKKVLYAYIKDEYENLSEGKKYEIKLDTQAPTNNSVKINNDSEYTNNRNVTLTLSSDGAKEMCISNTNSCSNWETYTTSKSHTLTSGEGTKTVYVWYKDEIGNKSEYVTDTIIFNTSEFVCEYKTPLGTCLRNAKTKGFNSTMEGGLYRYQGQHGSVNNFVCFGTSDKEKCLNDTEAHMYRVIGVNSSGQVKLIKNEPLPYLSNWYHDISVNKTWPNSNAYRLMKAEAYMANVAYVPILWQNKVATMSWKYGDITDVNKTASEIYNLENAWTNTVSDKVGLMYIHDYYYSRQNGGLNCDNNHSACRGSWLNLAELNPVNLQIPYEWTMSRRGMGSDGYRAWESGVIGDMSNFTYDSLYSIRPVIYLTSDTQYAYGRGTKDSPFMLYNDNDMPTNNSVSINNGAKYTNNRNVTLTLSSTGATEMCISETNNCTNWETYKTTKSWTFPSGDLRRTIYVWFKSKSGNVSNYVTDSIILDETAPIVSASINKNNTDNPTASVTSNEGGTLCINTSNTRNDMSNCVFTTSNLSAATLSAIPISTNGTYYAHVKDYAGNIGISNAFTLTKAQPFGTYLRNAKTAGFNSTLKGGLYRYQGENNSVNNYVCFGTSNKTTCTGNTDKYMYRIIGVNSAGQVKVIKKELLHTMPYWGKDKYVKTTWPNSNVKSAINGNIFYSTTYVPTDWQNKIATVNWKYGEIHDFEHPADELYNIENGWTNTTSAKIGLMYLHDYFYSFQTLDESCLSYTTTCPSVSWMNMKFNDPNPPISGWSYEFTMSYREQGKADGYSKNIYTVWLIGEEYLVSQTETLESNNFPVRPVFFLTNTVNYISGTGTASDPFIIS